MGRKGIPEERKALLWRFIAGGMAAAYLAILVSEALRSGALAFGIGDGSGRGFANAEPGRRVEVSGFLKVLALFMFSAFPVMMLAWSLRPNLLDSPGARKFGLGILLAALTCAGIFQAIYGR